MWAAAGGAAILTVGIFIGFIMASVAYAQAKKKEED